MLRQQFGSRTWSDVSAGTITLTNLPGRNLIMGKVITRVKQAMREDITGQGSDYCLLMITT